MEIILKDIVYTIFNNTSLERKVLTDINMSIREKKITSIMGKSGSGKSSLIQIISGIVSPTSGQVIIDGDKQLKFGLVFQNSEDQFIGKNLREELEYYDVCLDREIIDKILISVGLTSRYFDIPITNLSSGEIRKLAIASIICTNPDVIILDEPSIGLDSHGKDNLIKLLRKLKNKENKTIIIVSHDSEFIYKAADYIFILDKGKIVYQGSKNYIFKKTDVLLKHGLEIPHFIWFSNLVKKRKNIELGYRDDINDLVKDIYRHAR